ncbi:MAG: helix-turn-helix domain-containing protein [Gemmataceae bacterium]|nr:helix-turn-helix domain-containing protein [Gemmataceae bacterium]
MDRQYCKRCAKCRERTVVLAPVSYTTKMHHDGREYTVTIPDLVVPRCAKCKRFTLDHDASSCIDAAFRKHIDLLSPEEIRSQREALGLTQEELAEKLRIAAATLSRWETGTQIQQRSLDLLLRLFFKNPGMWRELERDSRTRFPDRRDPLTVRSAAVPLENIDQLGKRVSESKLLFVREEMLEAFKVLDQTKSRDPADYVAIFGDLERATLFVDLMDWARMADLQQLEKN